MTLQEAVDCIVKYRCQNLCFSYEVNSILYDLLYNHGILIEWSSALGDGEFCFLSKDYCLGEIFKLKNLEKYLKLRNFL